MKNIKGCLIVVAAILVIGVIASVVAPRNDADTSEPTRAMAQAFSPFPAQASPLQLGAATPITAEIHPTPIDTSIEYRQAMVLQGRELAEGIQSIGELMQDPQLTSNEWIMGMGVAIARIQIAHEE